MDNVSGYSVQIGFLCTNIQIPAIFNKMWKQLGQFVIRYRLVLLVSLALATG